jgi:ABC-type oligopeptide transport system ATPase subunit
MTAEWMILEYGAIIADNADRTVDVSRFAEITRYLRDFFPAHGLQVVTICAAMFSH